MVDKLLVQSEALVGLDSGDENHVGSVGIDELAEKSVFDFAIFPKGSGSSVAPYVILELIYRGQGPLAIVNTNIDQHSAPACSLEGLPYAFDFDADVIDNINHGDLIELERIDQTITIRILERIKDN